ncbi:MAG TPA: PAS domain S-box protein [Stellaceae bacterium]|nr:PAS domain S-box protein [Stellaceae bacterium]
MSALTPPSASEMARRVGEKDWSKTPLGAVATWSHSLKLSVALVLASGFPMAVRWGPELVQIYNDAYRAILREKHPQALGRPISEVWPEVCPELEPLSRAILSGERAAYFAEDHPWTVERDGRLEEARFTISYSSIPDEAAPNGIGGILVTCVETTERMRNEEALKRLNDRLGAEVAQRTRERDRIWQISEDLLGVADFAGRFVAVNPAWTPLLGWREHELRRMPLAELCHPDDLARARAAFARLAEGMTVRLESRLSHRNGSWRWLDWTMAPEEGFVYAIGRNVTAEKAAREALRESERQFRLLVAGVTDYAFLMLDPRGVVTSWNAGAQRIKGYAAHEIIGRHFSQFYTAADRAAGIPERALAEAERRGTRETEGWRVRKDGSLFFASVVIDAIRDEAGELIGFAKITRDITERRAAQEALQRAQEQLAQSQKMEALGQLVGGIAHDFNNMLMVVGGNAENLRRRLDDPETRRALDAIDTATARGENLTRQLLAFSRRQSLNPTVIDLGERLDAIRDILSSSARGGIALDIRIPKKTWRVAVDVGEFEVALLNLVVNARDAMPCGGTITIAARNLQLSERDTPERLNGEFVALAVRDTGGGIAAEILPKVFEPFFTTKPAPQGTGLGLSQVYGFTRQSGGTVRIASRIGKGTSVTLYLPRSLREAAAPLDREEPGGGEESILLVEDNPEVGEVARMLLEELGYRVHHVDNAAAALDVLASGEEPDLVLSDIVMPGELDGLALVRHVRAEYPSVAVLLTSGYARLAPAAEEGFPILRKPFQRASLARAVRDALDRRAPTRQRA